MNALGRSDSQTGSTGRAGVRRGAFWEENLKFLAEEARKRKEVRGRSAERVGESPVKERAGS